jgi:hypothetical protein
MLSHDGTGHKAGSTVNTLSLTSLRSRSRSARRRRATAAAALGQAFSRPGICRALLQALPRRQKPPGMPAPSLPCGTENPNLSYLAICIRNISDRVTSVYFYYA